MGFFANVKRRHQDGVLVSAVSAMAHEMKARIPGSLGMPTTWNQKRAEQMHAETAGILVHLTPYASLSDLMDDKEAWAALKGATFGTVWTALMLAEQQEIDPWAVSNPPVFVAKNAPAFMHELKLALAAI